MLVIGSNTTKYYYDGDNVINEILNGNSYATNVMGVNGYISRKQNGTVGYLFKDSHGDVLAAYSSTSNRIADYTYDAWGNIRNQGTQSWGEDNPLRYYGQYYDTESGMTYLRARYYDSSVRRFISEDSYWNVKNMLYGDECNYNTYAIVNNLKIYYDYNGKNIGKEYIKQDTKSVINTYSSMYHNLNIKNKITYSIVQKTNSMIQYNNLYAYCINNPIKYIDLRGLSVEYLSINISIGLLTYGNVSGGLITDDSGNKAIILGGGVGIGIGVGASLSYYESEDYNTIYDFTANNYSPSISIGAGAYNISWDEFGISINCGLGTAASIAYYLAQGYYIIMEF